MNYLTNYYKNLSEQLQEKVNNLEQLLEYRKKSTVRLDVVDVDPYTGEDVPRIMGTEVTKQGNPVGKGARKEKIFSTYPGMGAIRNMGSDQEALAWETVSDWGRPTVQDNPIYASMLGKGPALEVGSGEVFQDRSDMRRKGGSEPGMGKKVKKKNLAIALAQIQAQKAARDLNPNVHDGPDPDTTASAMEVAASQRMRQVYEKVNMLTKQIKEAYKDNYHSGPNPYAGPNKFSIVDQISGSMHGQGGGDESTYLVRGDDGYHYTIAPRYGKAQWAHDNEDLGKAPQTWELTSKHRDTFDIIDRIDNPQNPDHAPLIKRYNIEMPEEPDYDFDPPEAEDVHARIRLARSRNEPGTA